MLDVEIVRRQRYLLKQCTHFSRRKYQPVTGSLADQEKRIKLYKMVVLERGATKIKKELKTPSLAVNVA